MATTYPLPTLGAQVTAAGISAPSYDDTLKSLQASFLLIYGADSYVEPDSKDGQLLAIFAKAIYDCNQSAIAAYNAFAPNSAQGVGLSNMVKLNGISRHVATNSQVNLTIAGVAGTVITSGQAGDGQNKWLLPTSVVIPPAGFIIVTATAAAVGAIAAPIGTVINILTPTAGWQSVTNASAASLGNTVETDAELRLRQARSTALSSETPLAGLYASVAALDGVTKVKPYENDTGSTDANGLPPHSVSLVVQGGDAAQIATTILNKKGEGVATYGSTTVAVADSLGILRSINFFVPTVKTVKVEIELHALTGYTTTISAAIKQAVSNFISALDIGDDVLIPRLYVPAGLYGLPESLTYELTSLEISFDPAAVGSTDLVLAFNEKATAAVANITITVV